jgi:plasmid stability protein
MPVKITIKGVPERVRDELAARAAAQRKSMEAFLRCELQRIATRPSPESALMEVRAREKALRSR